MLNPIITPPRVPLVDPTTGLISRAWYLFFLSLNNVTNAVVDDPAVGPSAESLVASYDAVLQTLTQEVQTQPTQESALDRIAELQKQVDTLQVTPSTEGTVEQIAELQKQIEALQTTPAFDNYILPKATATTLGGVELFDATVQTTAGNAVTTTALRTYGVQFNSFDQLVVNVPWTDTDSGGTVTSVGLSAPTGFQVGGSPVTSSGTLALSFSAGYSLPTTASQSNWDTAFSERRQWDGGSTSLVAATGRTSLGATTIGSNLFTLVNPGAITFPRFNADNTVSSLDAATFRTAIGAGTSSTTGTVTSVSGTGTVNGLTLTGTVTTSGSLTLGGTLSGTASININGTVGATTPSTGAFTTLSATGVTTVQAGSAAAPAITTSGDTNTGIFFPAADTIAFTEGGVEAARFDASGRLLNGTVTAPSSALVRQALAGDGVYTQWTRNITTLGGGYCGTDGNGLIFGTHTGNIGSESYAERGRFDSSGAFIVVGPTAQKATGTTWSNPSDKRLKDNIRDYSKGAAELMQVRVCEWEYNGKGGTVQGTKGLGVIADEIMMVLPDTVENYVAKLNTDDEEATAIKKFDATEITWLLVKTVQEQQALIQTLTARVAALESN